MNIHYKIFRTGGKAILLNLVILSFAIVGFSQTIKNNLAEQAAMVSEFEVNGLKVIVKKRPGSATVAAGLFIRGGASNIDAKNAGIESLMLDTATEGSMKYPRDVLRRELASTGTSIGSGINNDFSVISLGSTIWNFERSFDIFSDIVINPKFDPADIARVRDRMIAGLRERETDNDNFLQILQDRMIYKDHPYANDVTGTPETLSKFTAKELRDFHRNLIQTSRMLLVVVGDVDANHFMTHVKENFGKLLKGKYKPKPVPALNFSAPSLDITSRQLPTNYVQGVFNAPSINDPDYYPMRIAISVLQSRIFDEVRVKRQLSYAPNAELNSDAINTGTIYVTTVNPNEAVKVMLQEADGLKSTLLPERYLSGISNHFLTLHYLDQETNGAQIRELAKYELIGGGWRNQFNFLDKIRQVTPEQVREVSKKYFKNIRFVVIGDPASIDRKVFLGN